MAPALALAALIGAATAAPSNNRIGDAWSDPRNPIAQRFHGQRLDLWSLRPIRRPELPPSSPTAAAHPIDRFINARLEEAGIQPLPEADPRALARRLSFDLTGLPPNPALVADFLADPSPAAYERLVDRLLASPHYGERQARLWLDVVRYSDSNGFDWDEFRPEAWRFRDYVVRSFNADKPFNQFVREQLAGDELLAGLPETPADQDLLVATGYLRIGPQDNSASLFNEQDRARAEWMFDLTETTGSAFLALTFNCCRCHDHKHDPLSQADYYRMRAFFEPLQHGDELALDLADDQRKIRDQHARIEAETRQLSEERAATLETARAQLRARRIAQFTDDERRLFEAGLDPQFEALPGDAGRLAQLLKPNDREVRAILPEAERARLVDLDKRIQELNASRLPLTRGLLATDRQGDIPPTRILAQGDHRAEREPVVPGFPSVLDPNPAEIPPPPNPATRGRRLALAEWIVSTNNPLTARVAVNRAWQSFFGEGLVSTPNDFGLAGGRPTHPELLDWLASEFMDQGWSVKRLHRLIVTSAAYRRASSPKPGDLAAQPRPADNSLLWRQNPRRLAGEQLRDAMLATSGLLRLSAGGRPVWPELPPEILQANPAFLDDNAEKTKGWYPSPEPERAVRSIYLVQKRTVRIPFLETFDLPDNSVSCPGRVSSIVAPQALTLMNGDEAIRAAKAFAERLQRECSSTGSNPIQRAFELAFQRQPSPREQTACEQFLEEASLPDLCRALLNLNEFAFID